MEQKMKDWIRNNGEVDGYFNSWRTVVRVVRAMENGEELRPDTIYKLRDELEAKYQKHLMEQYRMEKELFSR